MADLDTAYTMLRNGTIVEASVEAYKYAWGEWFFPILFLFTLFILAIKTENPAYVTIYAILGNVAIGSIMGITGNTMFYVMAVISLALVIWSFIGNQRIET